MKNFVYTFASAGIQTWNRLCDSKARKPLHEAATHQKHYKHLKIGYALLLTNIFLSEILRS